MSKIGGKHSCQKNKTFTASLAMLVSWENMKRVKYACFSEQLDHRDHGDRKD
jgi:hypothetical protein